MNRPANHNNNRLTVAAVQMVSGADVAANMRDASRLVAQAAQEGARFILLPENFAVFNAGALWEWGEKERQRALSDQVAAWAEEHNVWIVAGTLPQRDRFPGGEPASEGRVRTSSLVFSPEGSSRPATIRFTCLMWMWRMRTVPIVSQTPLSRAPKACCCKYLFLVLKPSVSA